MCAMIQTAIQTKAGLEQADAAFNARVPSAAAHKPGLSFVLLTGGGLLPGPGQNHPLDTSLCGDTLVLGRVKPAIATGLVWRFAKARTACQFRIDPIRWGRLRGR
jgi:hypothetical protein